VKNILFVNACVQKKTPSRTLELCREALAVLQQQAPCRVQELCLEKEAIPALQAGDLELRDAIMAEGKTDHPMLCYANQLVRADLVLIGAPYWDLSFPAMLKCWAEAVSVTGLTFTYGEDGQPRGLCRAEKMIYITTSGGYIGRDDWGYGYLKALFGLFGVENCTSFSAQGLDIWGANVQQILQQAKDAIHKGL